MQLLNTQTLSKEFHRPLSIPFTLLWVAWLAVTIIAHFVGDASWPSCAVGFVVMETVGALRRKTVATLSGVLRAFLKGGWSRGFLVLGFIAFIGCSLIPKQA